MLKTYLSDNRMVERTIFRVPELTEEIKETFPSLTTMEQEILCMEQAAQNYKYTIFCTPYVRRKEDGIWFVDIYLTYDEENLKFEPFGRKLKKRELTTKRLIITPGYMLSEEDECILEDLSVAISLKYNERVVGSFIEDLSAIAPEIHIKNYDSLVDAFLHTYYSSYNSGLRELLYKAHLSVIAKYLDVISGYNMIATNIENGLEIPIKMLRKLNYFDAIDSILSNTEKRKMAARAYKLYHGLLNNFEEINIYQIRYLLSMAEKNEGIDMVVLRTLGTLEEGMDEDEFIDGDVVYERYMEYVKFLNILGKNSNFPKRVNLGLENADRFYHSFSLLEQCIKNVDLVVQMKKLQREWKAKFSYEDDLFKIVIPETIGDLLDESSQQHNCLYTMIEDDILSGDSIVLFMRDKKNLKKSLVTVEILNNEIHQAKRACNELCTAEEKSFLQRFAKAKGLNPGVLDNINHNGGYLQIPTSIEDGLLGSRLDIFTNVAETLMDDMPFE